ncbi:hypothetical protein [Actinomadura rubrisoli]|uniref:Uncharacterized protein n=1 Tax=Actinomadura rubrisoli TaxID=2530368 RepID=A0A4R5CHA2_9ACTN|nr:hypothetical protein [Actinomadura rubrisoli]TDD97683.1 hypothetical protein E1298_01210 [Actinomadura rubrisoli]
MIVQRFPSKAGFKIAAVWSAAGATFTWFLIVALAVPSAALVRPLLMAGAVLLVLVAVIAVLQLAGGGTGGR